MNEIPHSAIIEGRHTGFAIWKRPYRVQVLAENGDILWIHRFWRLASARHWVEQIRDQITESS